MSKNLSRTKGKTVSRVLSLTVSSFILLSACTTVNEPIPSTGTDPSSALTESIESTTQPSEVIESASSSEDFDDMTDTSENEIDQEIDMKFNEAANEAQDALWHEFWSEERDYLHRNYPKQEDDTGHDYWWFAHAIDVMVDGYERTEDSEYLDRANKIAEGVYTRTNNSFINDFFDDMDWMALALLRIYDNTNDENYLQHSKDLFDEIKSAWSGVAGGGLGWSRGSRHFKNTPTNAPAVILAVRLYERTGDVFYQEWAHKIFNWLHETLRDSETGYINDGINDRKDNTLTTNAYTYNHGIYIGAALEMYRMTADSTYLDHAQLTYENAKSYYSNVRGIIFEEGEGDGGLFKGILMRYVTLLGFTVPELRDDVTDWVLTNATAAMERSTNDAGVIADRWNGPYKNEQHLSSHLSGVKVLEAAWRLTTNKYEEFVYEPFVE